MNGAVASVERSVNRWRERATSWRHWLAVVIFASGVVLTTLSLRDPLVGYLAGAIWALAAREAIDGE